LSKSTHSWWAHTPKNARRTAIGATAIGVTLALACAFVWVSPSNPSSPIRQLTAQVGPTAKESKLSGEAADLQASNDALRAQLAEKDKQLTDAWHTKAQAEAAAKKLKASKAAASARADAAEAREAAGSPSTSTVAQAPAASTNTGKSSTQAAKPITAPSLASLINPKNKLFGMYTAQAPFSFATYDDTAAKIGKTPNVVGYFGGWDQSFRADAVEKAWARGAMPVLTWESRPIEAGNDRVVEPGYELPTILSGKFDKYITKYAKAIVKTGLPLGLRFDHEMNGIWYPWSETDSSGKSLNGNSKGDYVKVWRYVHDIFEKEGANKYVSWIWSPNIVNNLPKLHMGEQFLADLYPGDRYVDQVGLSGYLRPVYKADNDFSFNYTFGPSLTLLRSIAKKPIFLAEIGASEVGGHKATWITSLFDALEKPENSDIVGFSWFNLAITSYTGGELATNDWRIDSRANTLAAFKAGISKKGNGFKLATPK